MVPLRRDRPFVVYFGASVVSFVGMQIGRVVLPTLVFQLSGSALRTGLLVTVQTAPSVLFGLVAGAIADRGDRRRIMIVGYAATGLALAVVPVLHAVGALTVGWLYVAAFVSASAYVWAEAADFGALPAIVGRARLAEASSLIHGTWTVAGVIGLPLGGVLVAVIGAPAAVGVNAATFGCIAATLPMIRRPLNTTRDGTGGRPSPRRVLGDIVEGWRFIRRHRLQWPITVLGAISSIVVGGAVGLVVVYGVRQLGLPDDDGRIGLLYAFGAFGALAATTLFPLLHRRCDPGLVALRAQSLNAVALVAMAFTTNVAVGLGLLLVWEFAITLGVVNLITLRQQITPDTLQGRVNATVRMIATGGQALGAALGGAVADRLSLRATYLAMAVCVAGVVVTIAVSPIRRIGRADVQQAARAAETAA